MEPGCALIFEIVYTDVVRKSARLHL